MSCSFKDVPFFHSTSRPPFAAVNFQPSEDFWGTQCSKEQQALLAEIAKTVHMEQTLKLVSNSQAVALATVEATGDEFAKKYPDAGSLWAVRLVCSLSPSFPAFFF